MISSSALQAYLHEKTFLTTSSNHGQVFIQVPPEKIESTFIFLKKDPLCCFTQLVDITAMDYPHTQEIHLVYILLSLELNQRLIAITPLSYDVATAPSVSSLFKNATWYEREIYDMFGLRFNNNHSLRRLFNAYNFFHHPLLKSFPIEGFTEMTYDDGLKRIKKRGKKENSWKK